MPTLSIEQIKDVVLRVLHAKGASVEEATVVARELAEANLVGHDSHGIIRLKQYVEFIETGHVKPDAAAFEQVTHYYDCIPGDVFFIDDNPLNTAAACRYGMRATTCQGLQAVRAALQDAGILAMR